MMKKQDMEPIVKKYYDGLEKGKILGRRCKKCGHIEFPPYLCCNTCGCLDTEWVTMNDVRGIVKQVLPTVGAFGDPEFRKKHGDYWSVEVAVSGCDSLATSLLNVDSNKLGEFSRAICEQEIVVKPLFIQDDEVKVVVWEIDGESEYKKVFETGEIYSGGKKEETQKDADKNVEKETKADAVPMDETAKTVIACAATAYGVSEEEIALDTNIREELSNESMKMIVLISEIEENLDATIEIQEANNLITIADFVSAVKGKM